MNRLALIALFMLVAGGAMEAAQAAEIDVSGLVAQISGSPPELVRNAFTFVLGISGLLAFGAIVYGAVLYTLAAGNPSRQSEGKEWIKQAIYGLLLLAGAYIILNTINPALVRPSLESLKRVDIEAGDLSLEDSACRPGQTPEDCNSLFANNDPPGGFCYRGGCYSNSGYLPGGIPRGGDSTSSARFGCFSNTLNRTVCASPGQTNCDEISDLCVICQIIPDQSKCN